MNGDIALSSDEVPQQWFEVSFVVSKTGFSYVNTIPFLLAFIIIIDVIWFDGAMLIVYICNSLHLQCCMQYLIN